MLAKFLYCIFLTRLSVLLPALHRSWDPPENTAGQVRRRLMELYRPQISREKPCTFSEEEFTKAA